MIYDAIAHLIEIIHSLYSKTLEHHKLWTSVWLNLRQHVIEHLRDEPFLFPFFFLEFLISLNHCVSEALFRLCHGTNIITLLGCDRISGHVPRLFILYIFSYLFFVDSYIAGARETQEDTL